jgi:hypothetical protein
MATLAEVFIYLYALIAGYTTASAWRTMGDTTVYGHRGAAVITAVLVGGAWPVMHLLVLLDSASCERGNE